MLKKYLSLTLFLLFSFVMCSRQSIHDSKEWFAKIKGESSINISGKWLIEHGDEEIDEDDAEEIFLDQDKEFVKGYAEEFSIVGKIQASIVYLHFFKGDYLYYVAKLKFIEENNRMKLKGKVIKYLPIDDEEFMFGENFTLLYVDPPSRKREEGKKVNPTQKSHPSTSRQYNN